MEKTIIERLARILISLKLDFKNASHWKLGEDKHFGLEQLSVFCGIFISLMSDLYRAGDVVKQSGSNGDGFVSSYTLCRCSCSLCQLNLSGKHSASLSTMQQVDIPAFECIVTSIET